MTTPTTTTSDFFRLIRHGDVDGVRRLLADGGGDVQTPNDSGNTPLMEAAQRDALEIVELLLARGATVDAVNNQVVGLPARCARARACVRPSRTASSAALRRTGRHGAAQSRQPTGGRLACARRASRTERRARGGQADARGSASRCVPALLAAGARATLADRRGESAIAKAVRQQVRPCVRASCRRE